MHAAKAILQSGVLVIDRAQPKHLFFHHDALLRDLGVCLGVKVGCHAAGNDAIHQQSVTEYFTIEPEPLFAKP